MTLAKNTCKQVHSNIDPIFGTQIQISPKFKALYEDVCQGDVVELCRNFRKSPTKNPLTNRSIKEDSHIFAFFTLLSSHILDSETDSDDSPRNNAMESKLNTKLDAFSQIESKIENKLKDIEARLSAYSRMESKFEKLEARLNTSSQMESKMEHMEAQLNSFSHMESKLEAQLNSFSETHDEFNIKIKNILKKVQDLENNDGYVPILNALHKSQKHIDILEERIIKYIGELKDYNDLIYDKKSSIFSGQEEECSSSALRWIKTRTRQGRCKRKRRV